MSGTLLEDLDAARRGDREAAGRLIEENGGLIWSVARRYFGRGVEAEDLYQLGCVGFLKAIEGFDREYGTCFSTYAVPKIAGESAAVSKSRPRRYTLPARSWSSGRGESPAYRSWRRQRAWIRRRSPLPWRPPALLRASSAAAGRTASAWSLCWGTMMRRSACWSR